MLSSLQLSCPTLGALRLNLRQLLLSNAVAAEVEAAEAVAVAIEAEPTTKIKTTKIKTTTVKVEALPQTEVLIVILIHHPQTINRNPIKRVKGHHQTFQITRAPVTGLKAEMRPTVVTP